MNMKPEQKARLRRLLTHTLLIGFLILVLVPYIMVVSASFRRGNFAPSGLLPDSFSLEHWKYVLGIPYEEVVNPATGEKRIVGRKHRHYFVLELGEDIRDCHDRHPPPLRNSGSCVCGPFLLGPTRLVASDPPNAPMVLALVAIYVILDFLGQCFCPRSNTHPDSFRLPWRNLATSDAQGVLDTIPASMEEAARIDGATQFQTFTQILLPMSLPIFAVVFILSFIAFMSEYPVASIVLQAREKWTLAVGANSFLAEHQKLWGRFAALAVLSGVPITVMFLVCQKFVVSGLTSGGAKE
jgi:maltose/maltodextrin transport system permease protein